MWVKFWGTRGSIPTPGRRTEKYGGNTTCVEVVSGGSRIILDGGTGIRELGLSMEGEQGGESAVLFSHVHWDHIQGLPFFVPFFRKGFVFRVFAPSIIRTRINSILVDQMQEEVFPVKFEDLSAEIRFEPLPEEGVDFGPFHIAAFPTAHPGGSFGYRIRAEDRLVVYASDNELHKEKDPELFARMVEEVRDADLLIADAQYTEEEYEHKRGWGHTTYQQALALGLEAGVGRLALTHHDPMRDDHTLTGIERELRKDQQQVGVFFAREGMAVTVGR